MGYSFLNKLKRNVRQTEKEGVYLLVKENQLSSTIQPSSTKCWLTFLVHNVMKSIQHSPKLNLWTRPLRSSNLKANVFPRPKDGYPDFPASVPSDIINWDIDISLYDKQISFYMPRVMKATPCRKQKYLSVSKSSGGSRLSAESQNFCITVLATSLTAPELLSTLGKQQI